MDRGLTQRQVARTLGANPWTYLLWEHDRTRPTPRFVPAILRFLGYDPFPKGQTLGERLRATRRGRGLTQRVLARELEVDPTTLLNWENNRRRPPVRYWHRILNFIGPEEFAPEAHPPN